MNKGGWRWLLLAGLSLAFLGAALVLRTLRNGPLPAGEVPSVTEIRDNAPLPAFALPGPKGGFTNADLLGRWSFMFFGYTQCPDICPTALTLMKDVKTTLAAAVPPAPAFQVVFVSVDPRRDTRELLSKYMAAFDPSFIGVSGDDAALAPLVKNLGVYYQRNDGTDTKRYTVDHSASFYLIDPQGRLKAVFSPPQEAAKVAANYRRITQR
ncbi:MAG: SCO family protein [Hydrogenophilales bacterium]|nr:SCO family protein [Hydrogenophilales bacterium]